MDMKISKRDAALLLGLLGVLALGLVYYFVYMSYTEKTDALKIENETLKKRVDVLQELANRHDDLVQSTEANRQATQELLERFPSDVREEDAIMLAVNVQGQAPYETITNLGIGGGVDILDTSDIDARVEAAMEERLGAELAGTETQAEEGAPASEEEMTAGDGIILDGGYVLKKRDITISGTATYDGFKESVKMLAERKDRTQLAVMASYDIESGLVYSQLSLGAYYMTGTGKLYTPPNIPFILQGTNNIFGTIELTAGSPSSVQPQQGGEEQEASEEASEESED